MKIEEYLSTLPSNILSGEEIQIPPDSIREIFRFAELGENDVFYHLGCGEGAVSYTHLTLPPLYSV